MTSTPSGAKTCYAPNHPEIKYIYGRYNTAYTGPKGASTASGSSVGTDSQSAINDLSSSPYLNIEDEDYYTTKDIIEECMMDHIIAEGKEDKLFDSDGELGGIGMLYENCGRNNPEADDNLKLIEEARCGAVREMVQDFGDAQEAEKSLLKYPDADVRRYTAEFGSQNALKQLVFDEDPSVRLEAAKRIDSFEGMDRDPSEDVRSVMRQRILENPELANGLNKEFSPEMLRDDNGKPFDVDYFRIEKKILAIADDKIDDAYVTPKEAEDFIIGHLESDYLDPILDRASKGEFGERYVEEWPKNRRYGYRSDPTLGPDEPIREADELYIEDLQPDELASVAEDYLLDSCNDDRKYKAISVALLAHPYPELRKRGESVVVDEEPEYLSNYAKERLKEINKQ